MTIFFVTRHPGAVDWSAAEGIIVDHALDHLDVSRVARGDVVIGTLPVNLIAEVNARGAQYLHLTLELPPELRGKELTAEEMRRCGARLENYSATKL
ncbi:MAG: CRISPR-associated protein Csx16 [Thiotrichales bacterium]